MTNHLHGTIEEQRDMACAMMASAELTLQVAGLCSCPACVCRTLVNGVVTTAHQLVLAQELELLMASQAGLANVESKVRALAAMDDAANHPMPETHQ